MLEVRCIRRIGLTDTDGPYGVDIDQSGRIAVTGRKSYTVEVFDHHGNTQVKFGEKGEDLGKFNFPCEVAMVAEQRLLVTDPYNDRVQSFSTESGSFLGLFGDSQNEFLHPRGITVDESGRVLVAYASQCCIYDNQGQFISGLDTNNDQLRGVCAKGGKVYTTDRDSNHVKISDYSGKILKVFGEYGQGNGQFDRPRSVRVTDNGEILVADCRNNRVQRFDSNGNFIDVLVSDASEEDLDSPTALSLTANEDMVVANYGSNKLLVFEM
uniref:E3 ubiquitin-protein ligase TRIM71-like n=1 Tax=Saccoglossus kowalevskii TaxID=10224 RepID=A0ABM0MGX2_SACKO|nr:PREDICTED: E3 ubiquitin-protein ligase TRIM71-like [Saccoglossus kowalevskii]